MVAVPAATAVTFPLLSTVATAVLLDFQVTALLLTLDGLTVLVRVAASPFTRERLLVFRVTVVAFTTVGSVTVTVQFALAVP
jgi:hypothetical protein